MEIHSRIGIYPGSFKPFHLGHYEAIKLMDVEKVKVIISIFDREFVKGETMRRIWIKHLLPNLTKKIQPIFASQPMTYAMDFLIQMNNPKGEVFPDHYTVYSDQEDLDKNFLIPRVEDYTARLREENRIEFVATPRIMSASEVRQHIRDDDYDSFSDCMPEELSDVTVEKIYKLLRKDLSEEANI